MYQTLGTIVLNIGDKFMNAFFFSLFPCLNAFDNRNSRFIVSLGFRSLNRTLDLLVEGTHVDLWSSSSLQGIEYKHSLLLFRASVRKYSNKFGISLAYSYL